MTSKPPPSTRSITPDSGATHTPDSGATQGDPRCPLPDPQTLFEFHRILRAAETLGVKLDLGGKSINQLESDLDQLSENDRLGSSWADTFPNAYVESLTAFVLSGRSDLALDRLHLRHCVDRELASVSRSTWLYLSLMMMVAAAGMLVFAHFSTPMIESIRVDLELMPSGAEPTATGILNRGLSANGLYGLAIATFVVAILVFVIVTNTRFASWSVGWIGGVEYRWARSAALKARIEQSYDGASSSLHLSGGYLRKLASSKLMRLRVLTPLLLIVLVGGMGVMFYCWLLFSPLISLIYDLSNVMMGST